MIQVEDVKLMASQRLADTDDGGGDMIGQEVVSGELNNLFPDISRWDRAYGRVSLREAFVAVQTQNTDTYSGSHVILSAPAKDHNVGVCLFKTGNSYDLRAAARDYIERYVVRGSRFTGWLWGLHAAGARSLLIFAIRGTRSPGIGDVLYLAGGSGQYVRITKSTITRFDRLATTSESTQHGLTANSYSRDIFELEIGDPLLEDQTGVEIGKNDSVATSIYTTVINNSAKYYGLMLPTTEIKSGDVVINVDSIYTRLVPSAQAESPLTDLSVGETNPVMTSGKSYAINAQLTVANGEQFHFNRGIAPGSLTISSYNRNYSDDGSGILWEGTSQRGTIDYATGTVSWANINSGYNSNHSISAMIGTQVTQVANSYSQPITMATQSNNYTLIMEPLPVPGTVLVDYMAQGSWYRLRDNGTGLLLPDIKGTGTGKVNYATGSLMLTCAALPDVGSRILYLWGAPMETQEFSGDMKIELAELVHQLPNSPIDPGSVTISWPSGSTTATASDSGGALSGSARGSINYSTGELRWKPTLVPASDSEYTITYRKYAGVAGSVNGSVGGGSATFTLPSAPIATGTLSMSVSVIFSDNSRHTYNLKESGGRLVAEGGGSGLNLDKPTVSYSYGAISGTIDRVNGVVQISLSGVTGQRTNHLYEYVKKHSSATGWYWLQRYKGTEITPLTATHIANAAAFRYSLSSSATSTAEEKVSSIPCTVSLLPNIHGKAIVPGSVNFTWGNIRYVDRLGRLYRNPSATTGQGTEVGTIDYSTGELTINGYDSATNSISLQSMLLRFGRQFLIAATFRTPGAPLRPGALQIQGVAADGRLVTAMAAADGTINGNLCQGSVDYELGIVDLQFGEMVTADGNEGEPWYDASEVVGGRIWQPVRVYADHLVYACVVYSYIPLDASLIGINPARLPVDGRVPIVRGGDVAVIHHTEQTQIAWPLEAGQRITLAGHDLDHVDLVDSEGRYVNSALYSLEGGILVMAENVDDLADYSGPLNALYRIEDMRLVSQVQINGQVVLAQGVSHAYPTSGTYISSALPFGDLCSRYYALFDQKTWGNKWDDSPIGDIAPASYNEIDYPVVVYNKGAVSERWALVFDNSEHFKIYAEKRGMVGEGYITQDCQPLNNATNQPYFLLDRRGWGSGWASGNVLRFNTQGANGPLWVVRTTLQGPIAEATDHFTLQIRGDAQ